VLRISVLSFQGQAPGWAQSVEFGSEGGSIGREEGNTLQLDDPGKHLSRVQANIKCLGGEYFLVDQGGNPSRVNARELGKGKVVSLHDGDRICMADWELLVECARELERPRSGAACRQESIQPVDSQLATELLGQEQSFDFQLAESSQFNTQPVSAVLLLEAFVRGLGVRGMALPGDLDATRAERMGEQVRLLLSTPQAIEPDALKNRLGAVLQTCAEAPAAAVGKHPC